MKRLGSSFGYALAGFASAIQTETNWKIGLAESLVVILASWYLNISKYDWIVVIILIGLVLSAELFNSAIEKTVDLLTSDQHPGAKLVKDFSAGAVVIIIIASAIVGVMIFLPYFEKWLTSTALSRS